MILCSGVSSTCMQPHPMQDTLYNDIYSCMIAGYTESISKTKEIGIDDVNEYKIYIKFYCTEYKGIDA
tara:strand:+ start:1842 stop:2045 length:204 start_codon:yes stop_codon:yes gene_type:complete